MTWGEEGQREQREIGGAEVLPFDRLRVLRVLECIATDLDDRSRLPNDARTDKRMRATRSSGKPFWLPVPALPRSPWLA